MSDTYNNVPMSETAAARVERTDAAWSGPKLIVLCFVVLGLCFALLWSMAEGLQVGPIKFGPTMHEADWGNESHVLEPGPSPRKFD